MKFTATILGCISNKKTYAAVKITADQFAHKRVIPLRKGTANQAELVALNYVLSAIKDDVDSDLNVVTSNVYVIQMTDKNAQGSFKITPEKNIELVQEMRNKLSARPRTTVKNDKKSGDLTELRADVKAFK